jgi:hypothetical protein
VAQAVVVRLYRLYGDGIFPVLQCIICKHRRHALSQRELLENSCMGSVRESVEWVFGDIQAKFPFIDCLKNMKLRMSPVPQMYVTCMLMYNCFITMNAGQGYSYFSATGVEVFLPTVEQFMR